MGKMMRWPLLLLLAGCAWWNTVFGQETAQEVLDNVKKKYESINDAELRFQQKVKFTLTTMEQSSAGTLWLKKDHKYRIEYGEQTIVTDGTTVWSYSATTHQVVIDHFKIDERSLTPEKLLSGAQGNYAATLIGKERLGKVDVVQVKLIPKDEQALVSSLRFWVDERDWMIRQMEIVDANGRQTTYVVQQAKLNIGIADARFSFQPPQGAEVVDLR